MRYWEGLKGIPAFDIRENSLIGIAHIPAPLGRWVERRKVQELVEAADREVAQLQARVAELEAALAAEREAYATTCRTAEDELAKTRDALSGMVEFFQPHAWGSEDNRAEALREAREVLGQ